MFSGLPRGFAAPQGRARRDLSPRLCRPSRVSESTDAASPRTAGGPSRPQNPLLAPAPPGTCCDGVTTASSEKIGPFERVRRSGVTRPLLQSHRSAEPGLPLAPRPCGRSVTRGFEGKVGSADPEEEEKPFLLLFAGRVGSGVSRGVSEAEGKGTPASGPRAPGRSGKHGRTRRVGPEVRAGAKPPPAQKRLRSAHLAAVHVEEQLRRPLHGGGGHGPAPRPGSPTALPAEPPRQPSA